VSTALDAEPTGKFPMSSPGQSQLPKLGVSDFGPGKDHVAEAYQNGKVFGILHVGDPVRALLANLSLDPNDPYTYVFLHGGQEVTRFENLASGTHEIPDHVVANLLVMYYGARLDGMQIRMCTCYGNMLRPGDSKTVVQGLTGLLLKTLFEGY